MGSIDTYTLKNLFLAFRRLYITNQETLKQLRKFIILADKKHTRLQFYEKYLKEERKKYIEIKLAGKNVVPKNSLANFLSACKGINVEKNNATITPSKELLLSYSDSSFEQHILILPPNANDYKIIDSEVIAKEANTFLSTADELMNSDFFDYIQTPFIQLHKDLGIIFDHNNMIIKTRENPIHEELDLTYHAVTNELELKPYSEVIYPDLLKMIFDTPIDENELYPYHYEVLKNAQKDVINKQIKFTGMKNTTDTQIFKVIDYRMNPYVDFKRTK